MSKVKWTKISQARKRLGPAFKSSWPYTLLGLSVGFLLLVAHEYIDSQYKLVALLVEHIGIGFIVSAIAVFFYEWGAHLKQAVELSEELASVIHNDVRPIVLELSQDTLPRALKTILRDSSSVAHRYTRQIVADIDQLVDSTAALQREGIWMKEEFIGVIADMLKTLRENAECFRDVADRREHRFAAPTSEDMIDRVLVAQMRSLRNGDTYDVITNLYSWRGNRLADLRKETKIAVTERDVRVRRIFNLIFKVPLSREEVRRILEEHMNEIGSGIDIKVLRKQDVEGSSSRELKFYAPSLHFGVFRHGAENLRIELTKSLDLSGMMLTMEPQELESVTALFDEAWNVAQPLSPGIIEECFSLFEDPTT